MPTDIVDRVISRYKQADAEYSPDPLTYKAFMSEFHQGIKSGTEKALALRPSPDYDEPWEAPSTDYHAEVSATEDTIAEAARDLLELARRLESFASRGNLAVNEHRLVPKMSGILSTLFYRMGYVRGLKEG